MGKRSRGRANHRPSPLLNTPGSSPRSNRGVRGRYGEHTIHTVQGNLFERIGY